MEPKVTFGLVNCNRLHYLRSCLESLLICTEDYSDKEVIIVDNASVEEDTDIYLRQLEERGLRVFRQLKRDPSNEFAKALNLICRESTGKYVCPLQADMQFVVKGKWLHHFVSLLETHEDVGCVSLDAQRRITCESQKYTNYPFASVDGRHFIHAANRPPVAGAGDVIYSKRVLDLVYPWRETNGSHEGGNDSETDLLVRVKTMMTKTPDLKLKAIMPTLPVSVMIYTDARGTNSRVRGNRRYGDYWEPKEDGVRYYQIRDHDTFSRIDDITKITAIEDLAIPVGWAAPIDSSGNWMKNPIRPETAKPEDYVELPRVDSEVESQSEQIDESHVADWLNE